MFRSALFLVCVGFASHVLAGYPESFSVGYGFVTHGGITPHGHYLPAVAQVKVHKDPFQSHYAVDEEGPTHYKYVRHSSSSAGIVHAPLLHHGHEHIHHGLGNHGHHGHAHHGHGYVHPGNVVVPASPVPLNHGAIGGIGPVAPHGIGLGGHYYGHGGYGGYNHDGHGLY